MAELNFNLLRQEGPKNLYEGFEQGRQAAAQNALAQQESAQKREFDTLRKQQIVSQMRASEQTQNRELVTQRTQQYRDRLLRAGTPDAVRSLIRQRHADPILGPATQAFGSLDEDLAEVPDDVNALSDYLSREAMGAAEFIKSQSSEREFQELLARVRGGQPSASVVAPASSEDRLSNFISQIETKQNAPVPMPAVAGGAFPPAANMLAPAPASTNAMAAPAGRGRTPEQIRADIDQFSMSNNPRAVRMVQTLAKEYEAALRGDQNRPLVVGNRLVSPTGQELYVGPQGTASLPVSIAEFERAKTDPAFMQFLQDRAAAIRPPAAPRPEPAPRTQQVTMSDGTLGIVNMDTGVITPSTVDGVPVKGKANKDLAVSEQQASYNLGRILAAAKEINAALKKDPNALKPGMGEASAASVGLSGTANVARSAQRQIVYGAQRDALDAMLYLATGAAYNKEQLEGQMAAYVPAFTDKPDAVEAKRVRMLGLIQNAKVRAGKAWTPEMDAASQALLLPVASSAKPAGGNKPPAAPGASNVTKERADANAAIAAGAPAAAVRARFKQNTGQEL